MGNGNTEKHELTAHDFFIQWHLTEKCNLRCSHCYQSETESDELSFEEIKEVTAEVSDMLSAWANEYDIQFSPSFNITGGEPFLRKDIFKIIQEIKSSGFDIYLLTNGTLIDDKTVSILSETGINGIQISIEGPEIIHDSIRGGGSYRRSLAGIKKVVDAGIEVTLNVTLSNLNCNYVHELISLASIVGVRRLGFSRLVPTGRGRQFIREMIETDKVKEIYDSLLNINVEGLDLVTGDPVASQRNLKSAANMGYTAFGGCAAGVAGLTFRPDGTINPCRRLNIPIGNVRTDSLREVWAGSEVLCRLRDKSQYTGRCGNCARWAGCRGCRAIAYAYSESRGEHDYLAEDPQCFIHGE